MDDAPIFVLALQSTFGLYGAIYVATAICFPCWFIDHLAVNHVRRRYGNHPKRANWRSVPEPWYSWPVIILTMIAVGVVVYAAVYAVVAVIPYDWGSHNEGGDWESTRNGIQEFFAFLGAIGLVQQLEKNAEVLVWRPIERKARQAIVEALNSLTNVPAEARNVISSWAANRFEADEYDWNTYESILNKEMRLRFQPNHR